MLEYYEAYLEGNVVAIVPSSIQIPQHIAEKILLLQLLERREDQTAVEDLVCNLFKSAKLAYDSNYFVVSFDTATCPDQLKLVTHVSAIGASFFIHHHQEFQRVPCFTCYSPFHSSAKCVSRPGARLLDHHKKYTRQSHASNLSPGLTLAPLDVAGRLKHVSNLTSRLAPFTTKLQADARKAPLLKRVQQSTLPEPDRIKTSVSATECQTQNEHDGNLAQDLAAGDWFDPGGNKKIRNQRKSNNSLGQATAMKKTQHHHAQVQKSPASSSRIPPGVTASTAPTNATPGQVTKPVSSQPTSTARPQGEPPPPLGPFPPAQSKKAPQVLQPEQSLRIKLIKQSYV
uniref:Uncharacterized protein n=1 Tax=Hyaloperonospora arabidopsidis (strain Emoy2) TaxID=559515 RepID=M4BSP5_HYAAE